MPPAKRTSATAKALIKAAKTLNQRVAPLTFGKPVTHVYNPLDYAWKSHETYLNLVGTAPVKVLFLGMNPGPWGMAQTGVPFGEIAAARDWLGLETSVKHPENEHPKRIVEGFACQRSEVSGRRLWGLFEKRYESPQQFFQEHFVANYCPLVFMEESARNRTPDKLPADERRPLDEACDEHLRKVIEILKPSHLVGVGAYAEKCLARVADTMTIKAEISRVLHPSPASPAANQDWAGKVTQQLIASGIWTT